MSNVTDAVEIWYVTDQTLCNFDCSYCVTQKTRRRAQQRMWESDESAARFRAILGWLASLPWQLRVRLQTLGEPFVSREFLDGAAWLSRRQNLEFVELVTNGSFRQAQFDQFSRDADIARLSLWMTYHQTEIELERLVTNAVFAKERGASVVVHGLLFPENLADIERMIAMCAERGIPTDVTVGHNYNDVYKGRGYLPVLSQNSEALAFYREGNAAEAMLAAHNGPLGLPCSAGHNYLFVNRRGDVFPCQPYSHIPTEPLGSALEPGFVPRLRQGAYSPCEHKGACVCKEDYLHLRQVREVLSMSRSLGYYIEKHASPGAAQRATEGSK